MDSNRVIAALCYFSIFFAPFLLPIIVFFVSSDQFVKHHAKTALFSHLIPTIGFLFIIFSFVTAFHQLQFGFGIIGAIVLFGLLSIIITIWNIIRGIRILMD